MLSSTKTRNICHLSSLPRLIILSLTVSDSAHALSLLQLAYSQRDSVWYRLQSVFFSSLNCALLNTAFFHSFNRTFINCFYLRRRSCLYFYANTSYQMAHKALTFDGSFIIRCRFCALLRASLNVNTIRLRSLFVLQCFIFIPLT